MARIYLAVGFLHLSEAVKLRGFLRSAGHAVPCRWIDGCVAQLSYFATDPEMARFARMDLEDLLAAEVLVCMTGDERDTRGGRHSELGAALATGKRVIILGPREQIFHFHPAVRVAKDRAALLEILR